MTSGKKSRFFLLVPVANLLILLLGLVLGFLLVLLEPRETFLENGTTVGSYRNGRLYSFLPHGMVDPSFLVGSSLHEHTNKVMGMAQKPYSWFE